MRISDGPTGSNKLTGVHANAAYGFADTASVMESLLALITLIICKKDFLIVADVLFSPSLATLTFWISSEALCVTYEIPELAMVVQAGKLAFGDTLQGQDAFGTCFSERNSKGHLLDQSRTGQVSHLRRR